MRRIIERVVTVVTTTTWKISWEADPPPSDPEADPVSNRLPGLEASQSLPPAVGIVETTAVALLEETAPGSS